VPASVKAPPVQSFVEPCCETQSALVTDNYDSRGLGRIRVKFHWMNGNEKSPWLRVTTPHAGDGKGLFVMPEIGEEVIVENTDRAISEACQQTQTVVSDYTVAPIYLTSHQRGGHEWLIEFSKAPEDIREFGKILDASLRNINSDYDAKRFHDLALLPPVIHSMKPNTFYNWLKAKGKLGGQNKVPRLSNERNYLEEILASAAGDEPFVKPLSDTE